VRVWLSAMNEKKEKTPAVLLLAAVDFSTLKLADEKTAHALPAHFYLTSEIRRPEDLEYADFLVSDHPKATAALDLLLGTQGWRRFAEQMDPRQFRKLEPKDSDRFLLAYGQAVPEVNDSATLRVKRIDQEYG